MISILVAGLADSWYQVSHDALRDLADPIHIEPVSSLAECVDLIRAAARVDLVVCDVASSQAEGGILRVLSDGSRQPPPVVVIASSADEPAALAAVEQGAADYVMVHPAPDDLFPQRLARVCHAVLERSRLTASVSRRAQLLEVIRTIGRKATSDVDLAGVLQTTVNLLRHQLNYERVAIYLGEPESEDLALCAVAGIALAQIPATVYHLRLGEGTPGQALLSRRLVRLDERPGTQPVLGLDSVAAELSAPILVGEAGIGTLTVASSLPDGLDTAEEELSTLAGQLAGVVHSAEGERRESERIERELLLTQISHVANSWLNPSDTLSQAVQAVGRGLKADRSAISLIDWDEGVFVTEHEHMNAMLTERRSLKRREPLTGSLAEAAQMLQAGQVLICTENHVHPTLAEYWGWLVKRHGVRSLIWVPIPNPATGRLYTFSLMQVTHARRWTGADAELLRAIADQLSLALRNAHLFQGMRRAAGQLEAKNAELEAFVYTVSHDLQAPVVSLRGFATLLQQGYQSELDERGQTYLSRIAVNAEYLSQLLQDLLELSRVGRQEEPDECVPVRAIVDEVLLDLGPLLAEHHVDLRLPPDWPMVQYSRTRLRQVFSNLLTNAVKFMGPQPHPRVELGWRHPVPALVAENGAATPGSQIEFSVKDNGIGIHPDYHQRIFIPFERLKQVDVSGTGVGLSIVKRIVEGRGGTLRVESAPGAGATFYFSVQVASDMVPAERGDSH